MAFHHRAFWQAAALREERYAAQQRREAAMRAQGGYSFDVIQLVLESTQFNIDFNPF